MVLEQVQVIHFDREIYFDSVRGPLFGGSMTEGQVIGQEAILTCWEADPLSADNRHIAYALATTKHETANEMLPISEYGKGQGMPYGVEDPPGSGNVFYGRGYCQLTWADNYKRATAELELTYEDDLYDYPDRALDPAIAADVMLYGMTEGWFRSPNTLSKFFNDTADDPYGAREIINGDKHIIPSWSNGVSIGKLIAGYHAHFLAALNASSKVKTVLKLDLTLPPGLSISISINGKPITP